MHEMIFAPLYKLDMQSISAISNQILPASICSAVSSPSDLMVMPFALRVLVTRFCAAVVFAWGLMNTKAALLSSHCASYLRVANMAVPAVGVIAFIVVSL